MIVGLCQRWKERRGTYRPAGEVIRTGEWEVAAIEGDAEAKAFVTSHHYSGSYPAARRRFGIYGTGGVLRGVAVFSVPTRMETFSVLPGEHDGHALLGRLVLTDDVPANGESWFIARCFELLRAEGWTGVVAFSDPVAKTSISGEVVFGGHLGTIYQATNAVYTGRSSPRTLHLLPDGSVLHARAVSKIRKKDRGWKYAAKLLEAHGADELSEDDDPVAWLNRWKPALTRRLRHQGNLKYAWVLDSARAHRRLGHLRGHAYPKVVVAGTETLR